MSSNSNTITTNPWFKLAIVALVGIVLLFVVFWGIGAINNGRYGFGYNGMNSYGYNGMMGNGYNMMNNGTMNDAYMQGQMNMNGMNMQGSMQGSMQGGMDSMMNGMMNGMDKMQGGMDMMGGNMQGGMGMH